MHPLRRKRKKPGINILPLLDVLTVILFFFLITMQFRQVRTLNLVLPEIKTAGSNQLEDRIIVSVDSLVTFFTTTPQFLRNNSPKLLNLQALKLTLNKCCLSPIKRLHSRKSLGLWTNVGLMA